VLSKIVCKAKDCVNLLKREELDGVLQDFRPRVLDTQLNSRENPALPHEKYFLPSQIYSPVYLDYPFDAVF